MEIKIGIDGKRCLVCEDEDHATRMHDRLAKRGFNKRIACFGGYYNAVEL